MLLFIVRDVMRTAHVVAGAVWVGGSVIYLLVLVPAFRLGGANAAVMSQTAALFRKLVNLCIGILVITGVYLIFDRLASTAVGTLYVITLVVKVVAALLMIGLALYQAQEARRLPKYRGRLWKVAPKAILWLGILTFLLGATLTGLFEVAIAQ